MWSVGEGRLVEGHDEGVVWDGVCMWCGGKGWLFDGMRRRDSFVMVCAGEGWHIDGEHRRDGCWLVSVGGTAFVGTALVWDGI